MKKLSWDDEPGEGAADARDREVGHCALNWDADEKIKKTILSLFNILNSVLITDIMMTMTHTPGGGHGAARRGDLAHPPRCHTLSDTETQVPTVTF